MKIEPQRHRGNGAQRDRERHRGTKGHTREWGLNHRPEGHGAQTRRARMWIGKKKRGKRDRGRHRGRDKVGNSGRGFLDFALWAPLGMIVVGGNDEIAASLRSFRRTRATTE